MGAEKPKLVLVPAGEAEAAAAAAAAETAGPGTAPDFWANRVPERKLETLCYIYRRERRHH